MRTATPILTHLALEHLRAVAEACGDHICAIGEVRVAQGNRAALARLEAGSLDLARKLGEPHLPSGCVGILRTVGTEAALMAMGMAWRSGESMDALAQRVWDEAQTDLADCVQTVLAGDHQSIMGRVRMTILAWKKAFATSKGFSEAGAGREIESLRRSLLVVGAICLLSAASELSAE